MAKRVLFATFYAFICTSYLGAFPAQVGFVSGVLEGERFEGAQFGYIEFEPNCDAEDPFNLEPGAQIYVLALVGNYNPTNKLTIFAFVPYLWINSAFNNPMAGGERARGHITGWGDLSAGLSYKILDLTGKGWFASEAVNIGGAAPTGPYKEKTLGQVQDRETQPGKGNWEAFFTSTTSYTSTDMFAAMQLGYFRFFRKDHFKHGDHFTYNAAVGTRVWPWILEEKTQYKYWATLDVEFLGDYKWKPHGFQANMPNTWENWGRLGTALSFEIADIFKKFEAVIQISFYQTVFYHSGIDMLAIPVREAFLAAGFNF